MDDVSRFHRVVSASEAGRVPYPYVYVNSDGTVRELHPNEQAYLETPFGPGDSGRPYVKQSYDAVDGWGDISGFCQLSEIPDDLCVTPAPAQDPTPPVSTESWIELAKRPARKAAQKKLLGSEQEWFTTPDPSRLMGYAARRCKDRLSDRMLRLIQVALARRVWLLLSDNRSRQAVEIAERFAEGQASRDEVAAAWQASGDAHYQLHDPRRESLDPAARAALAAMHTVYFPNKPPRKNLIEMLRSLKSPRGAVLPRKEQADVIRDVLGNPFRSVAFPPELRTDTALSLARQMYDSRDFSAMPILADALQDAGCDNTDILDHCRGPGPHVRGCWALDLVLGKE